VAEQRALEAPHEVEADLPVEAGGEVPVVAPGEGLVAIVDEEVLGVGSARGVRRGEAASRAEGAGVNERSVARLWHAGMYITSLRPIRRHRRSVCTDTWSFIAFWSHV
jgi:hypothetical protein